MSEEPHLIQNGLLSQKQMSFLIKGMKSEAIMSYCVTNELKLHCQCYLQFHTAQSPGIVSIQLFHSEDFSVRGLTMAENPFGSWTWESEPAVNVRLLCIQKPNGGSRL